jgi:hypothetical protein
MSQSSQRLDEAKKELDNLKTAYSDAVSKLQQKRDPDQISEREWLDVLIGQQKPKTVYFETEDADNENTKEGIKSVRAIYKEIERINARVETLQVLVQSETVKSDTNSIMIRPKIQTTKPTKWAVNKAKEVTPAEHVRQLKRYVQRTLSVDPESKNGAQALVRCLRDSLTEPTQAAIDPSWDAWEIENSEKDTPATNPSADEIQKWMEALLSSHITARDLTADHKTIRMEGSSMTALTKYTIAYQQSLIRLHEAKREKNIFDQKNEFFENLHGAVKKTDVKKFSRSKFLDDDSISFKQYVELLSDEAALELQDIEDPKKRGLYFRSSQRSTSNGKGGNAQKRQSSSTTESVNAVKAALVKGGMPARKAAKIASTASVSYSGNGKTTENKKGGKGNGKGGKGNSSGKGGKGRYDKNTKFVPCDVCGSRHPEKTECWHDPNRRQPLPDNVTKLKGTELAQLKARNLARFINR